MIYEERFLKVHEDLGKEYISTMIDVFEWLHIKMPERMKEVGITFEELAEKIGYNPREFQSDYLQANITLKTLGKIALTLGVDIELHTPVRPEEIVFREIDFGARHFTFENYILVEVFQSGILWVCKECSLDIFEAGKTKEEVIERFKGSLARIIDTCSTIEEDSSDSIKKKHKLLGYLGVNYANV